MSTMDPRWWAVPTDNKLGNRPGRGLSAIARSEVHKRMWSSWQDLRSRDSHRQSQHLHWVRLYGNRAFQALNPAAYTKANSANRLKMNVVRAVVDRVHARISQQRPRPWPVTTGGNWSTRRRARLLGRYLDAQFRIMRATEHGARAVKTACLLGAGVIRVWEDGHQVRLERALPFELFVDPLEAFYGTPRTLYQQRWVSRDVLHELYDDEPGAKEAIEEAGRTGATQFLGESVFAADMVRDVRADQVLVVEAWHLPSGPGAGDGYHAIATDKGMICVDPWEHDYFPFVVLRWDEPEFGFWSDSIPAMIDGVQAEINTYLQTIQSAHHLFGKPFIFTEQAKRASENTFTNEIGTFIETTGSKFDIRVFQTLSPEIYQTLEGYWNKAFELANVQQLAGSQIPAGLPESGVGLRTFNDMQAVAHLPFARRYEQFFVDLAHQVIDRARDLAKRNPGYTVPAARDRNTIESVKWDDVDMERDQYVIQVYPTSSLPAEPAGKLAAVETMVRGGMIGPQEGRMMLDFPDLDAVPSLYQMTVESVLRQVERMLDDGVRCAPSPYQDLQLSLKLVQGQIMWAENEGAPDDRIDLLRDYADQVHALVQRAQVEQMKVTMAAAGNNAPAAPGAGAAPAPGPAGQPPGAVTSNPLSAADAVA